MLVEGLPVESALGRQLLGHDWTNRDFMTAELADSLNTLTVMTYNIHREKGRPPIPGPPPWPRPGVEDRKALDELRERQSHDRLSQQLLPDQRPRNTRQARRR